MMNISRWIEEHIGEFITDEEIEDAINDALCNYDFKSVIQETIDDEINSYEDEINDAIAKEVRSRLWHKKKPIYLYGISKEKVSE